MTLREFIGRHKTASAIVAPAILGIAAVVGASFALSSAPQKIDTELTASVTECHDMVTISVAGRGDTPAANVPRLLDANGKPLPAALSGDHQSHWVDPIVNAPGAATKPGSYAAVYIAYPANMDSYENAVDTGVENSKQVIREISRACPNTRFSIVGYSEGGDVARRVAMDVGNAKPDGSGKYAVVNPDQVVGVVILADAGRTAGEGPFPGAKDPYSNPDGFGTKYQNGKNATPGSGALPGTSGSFGALNGKVASFCSDGDLTCSAPENISLLVLAANVGRQLNVDALQREGLTQATGQDVALTLADIAFKAFAHISADPNWMKGDETFLQVLLKVSDPGYKAENDKPGTVSDIATPVSADSVTSDKIAPLAYLPQKVLKEIVGLIATNQNTIPVVMNDPYGQTLGPDTGHHFDYWHDAADGKPMTSAQYAAAWLTQLAQQAQAGKPLDTSAKPTKQNVQTVREITSSKAAETSKAKAAAVVETSAEAAPPVTPEANQQPDARAAEDANPAEGGNDVKIATPPAAPEANAVAPTTSTTSTPATTSGTTTTTPAPTTTP